MMTLISRAPLRARFRRIVSRTAVACVCALTMFACTDARNVTSVSARNGVKLMLVPRYHSFGSMSEMAPINLARLTVLSSASRDTLSPPTLITLDPTSVSWNLPVDFVLPDDATHDNIVVIVELLNLTDGVQTIEWSGETPPISVVPGVDAPRTSIVDLVPGPPDNLNVVSVDILPVSTVPVEGDPLQLHAITVGSGEPQVFWTSLDADRATASATGLVTTRAAGTARIVASAGTKSDTITITIAQRAASVSASPGSLAFTSIGQTLSVSAQVLDARGAPIVGDAVVYIVADTTIATQVSSGTFRSRAVGSTSVSALAGSAPSVRTSIPLTVAQVPATIEVAPASIELRSIGATQRITATVRDAGANITSSPVTWLSENPAVATVAPDGTITARGAGTTAVTATSQSAVGRVAVTVNPPVVSATVTPAATTLESIDATVQLTAVARDAGSNPIVPTTFTWTSSAPAVATVSPTGLVTARSNGAATITATTAGGISATAAITVQQRIASIALVPAAITIPAIGDTARFTVDLRDPTGHAIPATGVTLTWLSDAPLIATVNAAGTITAVANGTANITARTSNGLSASGAVTVRQTAARVVVSPVVDTLRSLDVRGHPSAQALDARSQPVAGVTFTWSSSNAAVATVDADGVVTPRSSGAATISATANGVTGSMTVVVRLAVANIQVRPVSATLEARGETVLYTATGRDVAGFAVEDIAAEWRSSNLNVATVDASGNVTAVNNGTATISATAPNGATGSAQVVVNRRAVSVQVAPDTATIAHGQSRQLNVIARDANGFVIDNPTVAWQSLNTDVATVGTTGLVVAVADSGSATIRATVSGVTGTAIVRASHTLLGNGRVLIYHADGTADDIKTNMVNTGLFTDSQIDILQMSGTLVPLSKLSEYSCVLTFTNFVPVPSGASVGDRLKEYVDLGGRVVLMTYALNFEWQVTGGIASALYSPFATTAQRQNAFPRSLDFSTAQTSHPLMVGVTDFSYDGNNNYADVTMRPGATLVARDNFGVPLIGVNAAGNVIGINLFPHQFLHSPGVDRVIANACH